MILEEISPELISYCLLMLTFEEALQFYKILKNSGLLAMETISSRLQNSNVKEGYDDLVWKQFYVRLGFSLADCGTTTFLKELFYRRRLARCFFYNKTPPRTPQNFRLDDELKAEGQEQYPTVQFIARNQIVGSQDYRRSRRLSRDRSSVFSFDLISTGVAPALSVVDIDNTLQLTISRRSIGHFDSQVIVQECLRDESKSGLVVHAVVQRQGLTVIVLKYTTESGHRSDFLIHNNTGELQRLCLTPEAVFVDCLHWDGQPFVCMDNHQTGCLELRPLASVTESNNRLKLSYLADGQKLPGIVGYKVEAVAASGDDRHVIFISRKEDAASFLEGFISVWSFSDGIQRRIHLKSAVENILQDRDPLLLGTLTEPSGMFSSLGLTPSFQTELLVNDSIAVSTHCIHCARGPTNAGLAIALIWDTETWDLLALINIPVMSYPLPTARLDKNRLVILGQDHMGSIVLFYQLVKRDHEMFSGDVRASAEGSGGLHHFGRERLRFANRIRHAGMNCFNIDKLEMDCNERFLAIRTLRGNLIANNAASDGESDGIFIVDGGPR